ncbi:MAG: penicillin-binding protein activator [Gammaproteobacteria bacterium]
MMPNRLTATDPLPQYQQSSDYYLAQAQKTSGAQQTEYVLQAAGKYLQDNEVEKAQHLLTEVDSMPLTTPQMQQSTLLQAQANVSQHQPTQALAVLSQLQAQLLPQDGQIQYYHWVALANQQLEHYFASAEAGIMMDRLLTQSTFKKQNSQLIWQDLQHLSLEQLSTYLNNNPPEVVQGWLALAIISKTYEPRSNDMEAAIHEWRKQYPHHPAKALSKTLSPPSSWFGTTDRGAIAQSGQSQPHTIALLIPLQGPLEKAGQSIRNGFMAAYYNNSDNTRPKVNVYDTSSESIQRLYKEAIDEGNDFVVGPLTKDNILAISTGRVMPLPTLALNYSDTYNPPQDLYQLGLSPQDEAQQVAEKARHDGYSKALIIAPDTPWGQGIEAAFTQYWQQDGGTVVTHLNYNNQTPLNTAIKNLLKVNESTDRVTSLSKILGEKIQATPQRRQDADMVFLVASPRLARQIRPLLKFYYANDLPVYATAYVYSGTPNPLRDRDLDGIIFCDVPWLFANSPARQQMQSLWPSTQNNQIRFYALGMDAYNITNRLPQVTGMRGATGTLYMNDHGVILRELQWATFKNGKPKPLKD